MPSAVAIGWCVLFGAHALLTTLDVPGHGAILFRDGPSLRHVWITSGLFAPVVWTMSGWAVSRLHRPYSRLAVLVFIASVALPAIHWVVTVGIAPNAAQSPYLAGIYAAGVVFMTMNVLIGGLPGFLPTRARSI